MLHSAFGAHWAHFSPALVVLLCIVLFLRIIFFIPLSGFFWRQDFSLLGFLRTASFIHMFLCVFFSFLGEWRRCLLMAYLAPGSVFP